MLFHYTIKPQLHFKKKMSTVFFFFSFCVGTRGGKISQNMPSLSETGGNKMPMSLNWVDPVGPVQSQSQIHPSNYNGHAGPTYSSRKKHQKGSNKD